MSAPTFKKGQTVYDRAGFKYEFAEALSGDRALCRRIYMADGYDGRTEEYPSEVPSIVYLSTLSRKPPVAAVAAEVVAKNAELEALKEKLSETMRAVTDQEREKAQRLAALKDHPKLKRLEDFIAGKITHFVLHGSYGVTVQIKTLDEFLISRSDYGRDEGFKLLSLFGKSGGDLHWRVNHYMDGSGSWTEAEPTTSYEEAFARAVEVIEAAWAAWRADPENYRWLGNPIAAAENLGIPVPDDARIAHQEAREKAARSAVEKAEAELAKATAALSEARVVA